MTKEYGECFDPNKPALIVLYGATKRKFRPLESDLVVLGRAPCCDIGLVSPEVAPVHCVLVRLDDGWHIRDCSGRATRLNGKAIRDEPLRNGDTIQVGTFSFEAQLPPAAYQLPRAPAARPAAVVAPAAAPELGRLQSSRRRLAELALGLRRRLREQDEEHGELARERADLEQLERRLRKAHEEQMTRQAALTEGQKELARRGEELDRFAAHLRRQAALVQSDSGDSQRYAEAEAELVRQRVEQNRLGEELEQLRRDLEARQAELEATAEQLAEALRSEREQLDRDRAELGKQREGLEQERAELVRQRIELERLREQHAQQTPGPAATSETHHDVLPGNKLESARKLLRELAERRKSGSAPGTAPRQLNSRTRQARPPVEGQLG